MPQISMEYGNLSTRLTAAESRLQALRRSL